MLNKILTLLGWIVVAAVVGIVGGYLMMLSGFAIDKYFGYPLLSPEIVGSVFSYGAGVIALCVLLWLYRL